MIREGRELSEQASVGSVQSDGEFTWSRYGCCSSISIESGSHFTTLLTNNTVDCLSCTIHPPKVEFKKNCVKDGGFHLIGFRPADRFAGRGEYPDVLCGIIGLRTIDLPVEEKNDQND
jgi:hypothetical protein